MKVVILAGGRGLRISEESDLIPKPLIKIGNDPILIHIMRHFSKFNLNEFIIALGYKGNSIKEYFNNYELHTSNFYINFENRVKSFNESQTEKWKVDLIDTGELTMTGGRIKRLESKLSENFIVTYGDGVSDVNIESLIRFHKNHDKLATVTAVSPPGRYGVLDINSNGEVLGFIEKPKFTNQYINGGFIVFKKEVLNLITSDQDTIEEKILETLAINHELMAFRHGGFWQSMDTLRDKRVLEDLIEKGQAPWL